MARRASLTGKRVHGQCGPERHASYACQPLERRVLLAGNLHLVDAYFTDGDGNELSSVAVGQAYVYVQIEFQTIGLTAGTQYAVRTSVGTQSHTSTLNWGAGAAGTGNWIYRAGTYVIPPDSILFPDTVSAELDETELVAETNESDNLALFSANGVIPAFKMVTPLEGAPHVDWSIGNYVDLDVSSGLRDYAGGTFTYDGHNGWDIGPANWKAGDAGIDIRAAAAGTVVDLDDGNFDRNTSLSGQSSNFVVIDHGGGWTTVYHHMRRDSITVADNQVVAAGQKIGLMGSSGNSTALHLHFGVLYNGQLVEPNRAPSSYFVNPIDYSANHPTVLGSGVTNYDPNNELSEGPTTADVVLPGQTAYYWVSVAGVNAGDIFDMVWYRPDDSVHTTFNWTAGQMQGGYWVGALTAPSILGEWEVAFEINGVQKSRDPFYVENGGAPQARMYWPFLFGTTYIVDGRTTPFNLGTDKQWQTDPGNSLTFQVRNSGQATLTTSDLNVPAGFTVTEGLSANIAAGSSDTFTVRLDHDTVGHKIGTVSFLTNDLDPGELLMTFRIEGTVEPVSPLNLSSGIDTVYIRRSGTNAQIYVNIPVGPTPTYLVPIVEMDNFTLNTGAGNDVVTVDFSVGNPLTVGGLTYNGGSDTDTLEVIGTIGGDTFQLSSGQLLVGVNPLALSSVQNVVMDGAGGNDGFTIGNGDYDGMSLTAITVTGGAGADVLTIADQSDVGNDGYTLHSNSFAKGLAALLSFDTTESFVLNANPGNNTINVEGNVATTVNGGAGNDTIQISPTAGTLFNINGADITVIGGADTDQLNLFDDNYGGTANFTVSDSTVLLPFNGAETPYATIEGIAIFAGGGANTITVEATAPGTPLTLSAGGAHDFLIINAAAPAAPVTIEPSTGDDQVNVDTDGGAGATVLFNTSQRIGQMRLGSGGVALLAAGGDTMLTMTSLLIAATGKLDVSDNDITIDYTGDSPYETIRGYVVTGRNTGVSGIVSMDTPANDTVLAVVDNDVYGKTAFNGVPIDPTTIIGKYTYLGDANLDGMVTGDDYLAIDSNLGVSPGTRQWFQGDFNFDGAVTGDDYLAIDANLGKGTGNPLAYAEDQAAIIELHAAQFGGKSYVKQVEQAARGSYKIGPERPAKL